MQAFVYLIGALMATTMIIVPGFSLTFVRMPPDLQVVMAACAVLGGAALTTLTFLSKKVPAEKFDFGARFYNLMVAGDAAWWTVMGCFGILCTIRYYALSNLGHVGEKLASITLATLVMWAMLMCFFPERLGTGYSLKSNLSDSWAGLKKVLQRGGVTTTLLLLYTSTLVIDSIVAVLGFVGTMLYITAVLVTGSVTMVAGGKALFQTRRFHPDRMAVHLFGGLYAACMCAFAIMEMYSGEAYYNYYRLVIPFLFLLLVAWMCIIPSIMQLLLPRKQVMRMLAWWRNRK